MSNEEFLKLYARPGRIGLVGGATLIDRAIRRAESHLDAAGKWSDFSHALVFGEIRCDGHQWVIESDLAAATKHIRLGVQENRITKYYNEEYYASFAILDLGLSEKEVRELISHGLEMMSGSTQYSIRELLGTLLALRHPSLRTKDNLLARDKSFFCSAFVHHLYAKIGIDLAPGLNSKHTTPEDIARTPVPHTVYLLDRPLGESKIKEAAARLRSRIKTRLTKKTK